MEGRVEREKNGGRKEGHERAMEGNGRQMRGRRMMRGRKDMEEKWKRMEGRVEEKMVKGLKDVEEGWKGMEDK